MGNNAIETRRPMKVVFAIAGICFYGCSVIAQSPAPVADAALHARVDAMISKMSIEQKADYIGGTGFAIQPLPH